MANAIIPSPFGDVQWCADMLRDPDYVFMNYQPLYEGHNPFWNKILSGPSALRAEYHQHRLPPDHSSASRITEIRIFLDLGPDLTGQRGICHGGFLAAVMDQVAGVLLNASGLDGGIAPFTATLGLSYKKPVHCPGIILVTAKIIKVERRKIWVQTTIQEDPDALCTTAELLFVTKSRL